MGYFEVDTRFPEDPDVLGLSAREFWTTFNDCLRSAKAGTWLGEGEEPWFRCYFRYRVGEHRRKFNRKRLWERCGGVCYLCGEEVALADFHVEHVVPLVRGGKDEPSNVKAAHSACNQRKGTQLLSELDWYVE